MLVIYATVEAQTLWELEFHLNSHATSWSFWAKNVKESSKITVKIMKD